jgi:hypothetical protein
MIGWSAVGQGFLNFLQVAWKPLALGIGGIALAHFIWYGPRIDNLKLKLELEREQTERLEQVIESQNAAIESASTDSQEAFDNALEEIRNSIEERDNDTQDIIERIIEEGKPETCSEVAAYLAEQRKNLQWDEGVQQ